MIENKLDPLPMLYDALKSLKIVIAGEEAIRRGRTIYFKEGEWLTKQKR